MKNALLVLGIGLAALLVSGCAVAEKAGPVKTTEATAYYENGNAALKSKDYDRAIDSLQRALALKPDFPEALNLLGMSYFYKNDYKTARGKFERAIALNPSYAFAYANLGNLYFMTGQPDKAEELLKRALGISPNLVSAYYSLGAIYVELGRADEAATYLTKGLELDPDYFETHKSFIAAPSARSAAESYFAWARVFALRADVKKTLQFLESAKRAGFRDWGRIASDKAFDLVRDNPEIRKYFRS